MVSSAAFDMLVILVIGLCLALMYFVWQMSLELKYHEELLKEHIDVLNDHAEHLENAKNVIDNHANHINNINDFIKDLEDCLGDLEGGDDQMAKCKGNSSKKSKGGKSTGGKCK